MFIDLFFKTFFIKRMVQYNLTITVKKFINIKERHFQWWSFLQNHNVFLSVFSILQKQYCLLLYFIYFGSCQITFAFFCFFTNSAWVCFTDQTILFFNLIFFFCVVYFIFGLFVFKVCFFFLFLHRLKKKYMFV